MNKSVVVVGIGEIGSVFARGFLRTGFTVYPVTRNKTMQVMADELEQVSLVPELVLIAVGEADLDEQLASVPQKWKDKIVLIQNELLPGYWQQYNIEPTVISVWFEKKKGQDSKVIISSPVFGRHAQCIVDALASIDIAARELGDDKALLHELVLKNVYILTTNIAGLAVGGNVGQLWSKHNELAKLVAEDVIRLQEALTGKTLNSPSLVGDMVTAFDGDREHKCMGRSAPARLQRVLALAAENKISLPEIEKIDKEFSALKTA